MTDRAEDPLIEEALRWFVVLRDGSPDENDRRAFERWRATDAAHEAAWQRAHAVWAQADVLEPVYGRTDGAVVTAFPGATRPPRRLARRRWLQAAAVAAIAAPAGYMASRPELWADHRTAAGERRMVTLADGSVHVFDRGAMGIDKVVEAIQAGAKDFVVKPFQPGRVLEAVQRVLAA